MGRASESRLGEPVFESCAALPNREKFVSLYIAALHAVE